jgi:hypothetical protein
MHYTFIDEKRVSNHLMKDRRTFVKLQEAIGLKHDEERHQGYAGTPGLVAYNASPPPPLPANGVTLAQGQQNPSNQNDGYILSKGHIIVIVHCRHPVGNPKRKVW